LQILQQSQAFLSQMWGLLVQELAVLLLALLWVILRVSLLALQKKEKELRLILGQNHVISVKRSPTQQEREGIEAQGESDTPKIISLILF